MASSDPTVTSPYFEITCATPDVEVFYTLDGSDPDNTDTGLGDNLLQITSGTPTTIKVRAYKEGMDPSDIATCTYTPITLFMSLPDGSKPVYDRGSQYGEYCIGTDGYPRRLSSGDDWRYIICEEYDLNYYETGLGTGGVDEEYTGKSWGIVDQDDSGANATAIGTGKDNTDYLIGRYNSDTYLWYYVNQHRTNTGKDWSVPSKDELNVLYENKATIGNFSTNTDPFYWASSEYYIAYACYQSFLSNLYQSRNYKSTGYRVRCIRYV